MDTEDEKIKCYVCKKMVPKKAAMSVGNDIYRCNNHRQSSILKASQGDVKPEPSPKSAGASTGQKKVPAKINEKLNSPWVAEVETIEAVQCPHCGAYIIIKRG